MEIGGIGTAQAQSASALAGTKLADNFETFLTLLTTQLQNQDPLSPLSSTEFTNQLVQFTNVEQGINTNRNLELLLSLMRTNQMAGAVGFLGKTVEVAGDTALLANGQATWTFTLPDDAESAAIRIVNEDGVSVYTTAGETTAGPHTVVWNGLDDSGVPQPGGAYRIVVVAQDAAGNALHATTSRSGLVTAVDTVDGQQMLVVGDTLTPLDAIISVKETQPAGS